MKIFFYQIIHLFTEWWVEWQIKRVCIDHSEQSSKRLLPFNLLCCSSPEWQEAADGHVHSRVFVPGLCGDLPGDVASAAGRLEAAGSVLSHDTSNDGEREAHQHPGAQQEEHGGGRQSLSGATPPVNRVHYAPCQEERSCGKNEQEDKRQKSFLIMPNYSLRNLSWDNCYKWSCYGKKNKVK